VSTVANLRPNEQHCSNPSPIDRTALHKILIYDFIKKLCVANVNFYAGIKENEKLFPTSTVCYLTLDASRDKDFGVVCDKFLGLKSKLKIVIYLQRYRKLFSVLPKI
jgi:hypothetical protein